MCIIPARSLELPHFGRYPSRLFLLFLCLSMTDADSQAVFATRVQQLGLGAFWNNFTGKRWTTHGLFAHATIQQPGTLSDDDFRRDILSYIAGDQVEEHYAAVAMLHSESWAIVMREAQSRKRR